MSFDDILLSYLKFYKKIFQRKARKNMWPDYYDNLSDDILKNSFEYGPDEKFFWFDLSDRLVKFFFTRKTYSY